jgi:hypothetical protein
MGRNLLRFFPLALAASFVFLPASAQSQKKSGRPKPLETKIQNYFGGVFLVGDGGIPDGPCFRINGRLTSAEFFNQLKSYDTADGTIFRLGTNEVTQFPDKVLLTLTIRDQPCSTGLQPVGTGAYLTQEAMSSMRLSLRGSAPGRQSSGSALFRRSHPAIRLKSRSGTSQAVFVVLRTWHSRRRRPAYGQPRAHFSHVRRAHRCTRRRASVICQNCF